MMAEEMASAAVVVVEAVLAMVPEEEATEAPMMAEVTAQVATAPAELGVAARAVAAPAGVAVEKAVTASVVGMSVAEEMASAVVVLVEVVLVAAARGTEALVAGAALQQQRWRWHWRTSAVAHAGHFGRT